MTKKPEVMYKETHTVFRLRALLWLLQQNPEGLTYEETMNQYNKQWPDYGISKESVVRSLKILHHRSQVECHESEDDHRRCLWVAGSE